MAIKEPLFYKDPETGIKYPLEEATYDMAARIYKSDRRKSKPSDPHFCVLAKGICRNKAVLKVFVGSGYDAYVIFKATEEKPAHAVHFIIRTTARKVIDKFDTEKKCESQIIMLVRPPKGKTLAHRAKLNARRKREIEAGAKIKARGPIRRSRMQRLGVTHRPRAHILKGNPAGVQIELAL